MHLRKITAEGRVNIPIELLEKYDLSIHDLVVIEDDNKNIIIRKCPDFFRCAITNKVFDKQLEIKIGESYISREGLDLIEKYFKLK